MRLRRRSGAVLGLVAACVIVIVILGIGLYFLTKMFGGGREVAHATDSGILNVAKQELDSPNVSSVGTDFEYCGLPMTSKVISLYTYNRCVGQAMLVALNAAASGSTTAGAHAQAVQQQLVNSIEKPLQAALVGGSNSLQSAFSNLANSNNTRMSGNNIVQSAGYGTAYMKGGTSNPAAVGSSNLYFPTSLNASIPAISGIPLNTTATLTPASAGASGTVGNGAVFSGTYNGNNFGASYYVQGYKSISIQVPGVGPLNYMCIPTFPLQPPHIVSLGDFNACTSPPAGDSFIPPNTFRVSSKSLDSTAGNLGGAVACALVGSVDGGYAASIPAGYIEIFNRPGTALVNPQGGPWIAPVDNSNNIFNNEMFGNPGVSVAMIPGLGPNGSAAPVFSCAYPGPAQNNPPAQNLVDMWAAYNSAMASYNPAAPPPNPAPVQPPVAGASGNNGGLDDNIYLANQGQGIGASVCASISTLKKIPPTGSGTTQCMQQEVQQGYLNGDCLSWMNTVAVTYNRTMPTTGNGVDLTAQGPIFSNVDYIKMVIIQQFQNRFQSFLSYAPNTPNFPDNASMNGSTGMGVFTDVSNPNAVSGLAATYPSPQNTMPIMKPMSPWNYLQQIDAWGNSGNCGTSATTVSILNSIWHRCQQIQPTVTQTQVQNLLNSNKQFGMGVKFFIYLPHADQTLTGPYGGLAMDTGGAASPFGGPVGYNSGNPAIPDGTPVNPQPVDPTHNCLGTYVLIGRMVDVPRVPQWWGSGPEPPAQVNADLNLHAMPYYGQNTQVPGQPTLTGVDHALWQDSSGYGNLLGHLEFANTILGANIFNTTN
ncbi:MAG: hypothetical protein P4L53_03105 [Candidatus Obscuribacterales bacterium]|nr:hypothetical protein [Candidatus Obscuribacterales bacterium]